MKKAEGGEGDIDLQMATVLERYEAREETFQKLQMLQYRFMARFGKDKTKPFDDLRECVNSIFFAARMLSMLWKSIREEMDSGTKKTRYDKIDQLQADLYWGDDEKDRITPKVEAVVKAMEEICQKIIGAK